MSARSIPQDPGEHAPPRAVMVEYLTGRALYERVIRDGVGRAKVSVWIATANLKDLWIEPPETMRVTARDAYISVMELFESLAHRGVELRLLHSGIPSSAFARELIARRELVRPRGKRPPLLEIRRCPRVHFKAVVVDGSMLYTGSANWTGAGLGAKGSGRRNFEIGMVTNDEIMLDDVQRMFDHVWSGRSCRGCALRDVCPAPLG